MTTLVVLGSIAAYLVIALVVARRVVARWVNGDAPTFETLNVNDPNDQGVVAALALLLGLIWWLHVPLRCAFCFVRRPYVRRRRDS